MRLWRDDLRRTGHGLRKDPNPPKSLIDQTVREDDERKTAIANNWQARIAHRLQQKGFLLKETAFAFDVSITHVHRLLTHVLPNARKLR